MKSIKCIRRYCFSCFFSCNIDEQIDESETKDETYRENDTNKMLIKILNFFNVLVFSDCFLSLKTREEEKR